MYKVDAFAVKNKILSHISHNEFSILRNICAFDHGDIDPADSSFGELLCDFNHPFSESCSDVHYFFQTRSTSILPICVGFSPMLGTMLVPINEWKKYCNSSSRSFSL